MLSFLLIHLNSIHAQCISGWQQPTQGIPGVSGYGVTATAEWDPDGPGPKPAGIVVGGIFGRAGREPARNVAFFDGQSWTGLGVLDRWVWALAVLPDGSLVAGLDYTGDGSPPSVVQWTGSAWAPLGTGLNGVTYALAVLPNGDLVAAGGFTTPEDPDLINVARWDGSAWHAIGHGLGPAGASAVYALAVQPNGDVFAGGVFTTSGDLPLSNIARWNGSEWTNIAAGCDGPVNQVCARPGGGVVISGDFANYAAIWDGAAWLPFPIELYQRPDALLVRPNGNIIISGGFDCQDPDSRGLGCVIEWDGNFWNSLDGGVAEAGFGVEFGVEQAQVLRLSLLSNGDVIAGGNFSSAGIAHPVGAAKVARWDGSRWSRLGDGINWPAAAVLPMPDGGCVIGGFFRSVGGIDASKIARTDGSTWTPLGPGFDSGQVNCLARLPNGDIVAGGSFTSSDGLPMPSIARWDGNRWNPMGQGFQSFYHHVDALLVLSNGDMLAAGHFWEFLDGITVTNLARWDGSSWHAFGGTGIDEGCEYDCTVVNTMIELANGDVVIGGDFKVKNGTENISRMARWDGSAWHNMKQGLSSISRCTSLIVMNDGTLVAGGAFTTFSAGHTGVIRWDGTRWQDFGCHLDSVTALAPLPGGGLVAAGSDFRNACGTPVSRIALWDTTSWHDMDGGVMADEVAIFPVISALAVLVGNDVVVGGDFLQIGAISSHPQSAAYLARWSPCSSCRADFNQDGFVTGDDFDAFVALFIIGDASADIDGNGFVNGDDFDLYIAAFELGC